jgi:rRNA-processing protein FCF1
MQQVRTLHEALNCPFEEGMVNSVRSGSIADCPVTAADIRYWYRNVLTVEGCNICGLSKLSKPPTHLKRVTMQRTLSVDTMFVRGIKENIPILLAIDSASKYCTPDILERNNGNNIHKSILATLNKANAKMIQFDVLCADPDRPTGLGVKLIYESKLYPKILTNIVPTGTHVAEVETQIATARRKMRAKYAKFKANTGVPMPIQFEARIMCNVIKLLMHISSTATLYTSTPAVLYEEEKLSYKTISLVESGDVIIGYKDNGDTVGQYAVALDHTFSYPPVVTHAYNLDINNESSGDVTYARFVRANYDRLPSYVIKKLRDISEEGRQKYKEQNKRAKSQIEGIKENMRRYNENHPTFKSLKERLNSTTPPCEDIEEVDNFQGANDDRSDNNDNRSGTKPDTQTSQQTGLVPDLKTSIPPPTPTKNETIPIPNRQKPLDKIPTKEQRKMEISVRPVKVQKALLNQIIEQQSAEDTYEVEMDIHNLQQYESFIFHMSSEQACKQYPNEQELILKSVKDEWKQLLLTDDPNKLAVLKVMNRSFNKKNKKIIPSLGFNKRKIDKITSQLDKWKYRVVAGGHRQDPNEYSKQDTSSPTLDHNAMLLYLSTLMRIDGIEFSSADFTGAYLNSNIDEEIYMTINKRHVEILLQDPDFAFLEEFVRYDGTIITQIQKGIYGLKQAGKLWYDRLTDILTNFGMKKLDSHECIFKLELEDGRVLYIAAYVDDILIATNDPKLRVELINHLKKDFPDIEAKTGNKHSFLGMGIEFDYVNKTIKYDNIQYLRELCNKYGINEGSKYPYDKNLLKQSTNTDAVDSMEYKSLIMSIFYVSRHSRPETLFAISYLAQFSNNPDRSHWDKAIIILRYLYRTINYKLIHRCDDESYLNAYIDASYAIHHDAKSHAGSVMFDGKNLIDASSNKLQHMNKASTDAEVSAVHHKMNTIETLRELYHEITGVESPVVIYQDNKSAIHLMTEGTSISNKSKHMKVRYFYVKEKHDNGIVIISYMNTHDMIADILTKPLFGEKFDTFVKDLYNH